MIIDRGFCWDVDAAHFQNQFNLQKKIQKIFEINSVAGARTIADSRNVSSFRTAKLLPQSCCGKYFFVLL